MGRQALSVATDTNERAQAAVSAFRKMQHSLTAYARATTGNPRARVEIGRGVPHTDGNTIFYRPPIALGDKTPHNKNLCGERDESDLKSCPACRTREEVLVNIYHEIAHIAFGTFNDGIDYKSRGAEISPFMPHLFNALEDARVDAAMFNARKGIRRMMVADNFNLLSTISSPDGGVTPFSELPLSTQATMAVYLEATYHEGWQKIAHEKVAEDLTDPKMLNIVDDLRSTRTAAEVYEVSLAAYQRLRDLGYFEQPEPEPEPEPESDENESEPDENEDSNDERDDSPTDQGGEDGEAESDEQAPADEAESGEQPSPEDAGKTEGEAAGGAAGGTEGGSGDDAEHEPAVSDHGQSPSGDLEDESGDQDSGATPESDRADEGESQVAEGSEEAEEEGGADRLESGPVEAGPVDNSAESASGTDAADAGPEAEGATPLSEPLPELGEPEDVEAILQYVHDGEDREVSESEDETKAISVAVVQSAYFDSPSLEVAEVVETDYDPDDVVWAVNEQMDEGWLRYRGIICDVDVPETILGSALLKTRRTFSDNQNSAYQPNLTSGRVNAKVLGRRAWKGDDDRLFGKKRIPAKKDYAVQIMMDISSSNYMNNGENLKLMKRAVSAQAELCHRVGIKFSIIAHSAHYADSNDLLSGFALKFRHVKKLDEPWSKSVAKRVATIAAEGGNLDGHALEFGRKMINKTSATDKIILYYTDGKMPAANKEEETPLLEDQIKRCNREGILLLGVGINTNSPVKYGLDTVMVESDDDLASVVDHLGKRLSRPGR